MVDIQAFVGGLVGVFIYPFFVMLLIPVLDSAIPTVSGLARFLFYLIIPIFGIRILYVWAKATSGKFNDPRR